MKIVNTQYNLENRVLEIYVSGCTIQCPGCHNAKIKDFASGSYYEDKMASILKTVDEDMVEAVHILGGEPLDQDKSALVDMISKIKEVDGEKDIVLFTGYDIETATLKLDEDVNILDYIKCGPYDENVTDTVYIEELGLDLLSNQSVYKVENCVTELVEHEQC